MRHLRATGLVILASLMGSPAGAATTADGVVLINQNAAIAGSLTPGDTPGFPIEIKVGGSYRLSSDLVVPADQNGIYVTARNVTIDLNGFTIRGGNTARNGIRTIMSGLTVRNGTIQFFAQDGIYAAASQLRVEDMRILNNARNGINEPRVDTPTTESNGNALIKNNVIMQNGTGLECQAGCRVEGNVVSKNTGDGIVVSYWTTGGTVIDNNIFSNGGYGVRGDYLALGGNTIMFNTVCHTSGVSRIVIQKNAISPESGPDCPALPGN